MVPYQIASKPIDPSPTLNICGGGEVGFGGHTWQCSRAAPALCSGLALISAWGTMWCWAGARFCCMLPVCFPCFQGILNSVFVYHSRDCLGWKLSLQREGAFTVRWSQSAIHQASFLLLDSSQSVRSVLFMEFPLVRIALFLPCLTSLSLVGPPST